MSAAKRNGLSFAYSSGEWVRPKAQVKIWMIRDSAAPPITWVAIPLLRTQRCYVVPSRPGRTIRDVSRIAPLSGSPKPSIQSARTGYKQPPVFSAATKRLGSWRRTSSIYLTSCYVSRAARRNPQPIGLVLLLAGSYPDVGAMPQFDPHPVFSPCPRFPVCVHPHAFIPVGAASAFALLDTAMGLRLPETPRGATFVSKGPKLVKKWRSPKTIAQ